MVLRKVPGGCYLQDLLVGEGRKDKPQSRGTARMLWRIEKVFSVT